MRHKNSVGSIICRLKMLEIRETIRQTDRQTDRQSDRQTDRQTDTQTQRYLFIDGISSIYPIVFQENLV